MKNGKSGMRKRIPAAASAVLILAAGLTGTAQLQVTERKPRDVYIGFLMGFVVEMGLAAYYLLF